jgi:hypothetical protein
MGVTRMGNRFGVTPIDADDVDARDDEALGKQRKGDWSDRTPERSIKGAADLYNKDRPWAARTTLNQVVDELKLLLEEIKFDGRWEPDGSASLRVGGQIGKFGPEGGLKGAVAALKASPLNESVKVKVVSGPWNGLLIECRIANGNLDLTLDHDNAERRAILYQQSPELAKRLALQLGAIATITVHHAS